MRFIRTIVMVTVSCVMIAPVSLKAGTIIDFEDAGPPHNTTSVSSRGFTFTSSNFFQITGDRSDASQNGTLTLYNVGRTYVTMTIDGGGVFDLFMADLGEGTLEAPSTSILVTGFFSDGGSISELLNFDGVLPDFETVSFTGFSNLSSITFEAFGGTDRFSLDNIVVPEPGTLILLTVGAVVVVRRRKYTLHNKY